MKAEPTNNPGPLDFPHCWTAGDTISGVVMDYDGPTLTGSVITLSFSTGQVVTGSFVFQPTVELPDRHVVTFGSFEPLTSADGAPVKYKLHIDFGAGAAPIAGRTIYAGKWQLKGIVI